jgi:hypothetical protein
VVMSIPKNIEYLIYFLSLANAVLGFDYIMEEPAWQGKCSLKRGSGRQKQYDVPGCGGRLDMRCDGGCLRILQVIYSCEDQSSANPEQLLKVQERCEEKESCMVSASRQTFGDEECPDAEDYEMSMWIVYRCDGGVDKTKRTGVKECKKCGKEGKMVQKDVLGCGGKISMSCKGGCLKVLKVLYSCKEKKNSNADQLKRVKKICKDKEECEVAASREMFGYNECTDATDDVMKMWIVYRCDAGIESHALTGPETCKARQGNCDEKDKGVMVQKDVPGCGGKIELSCVGGSLKILKLLYSCQEKKNSNAEQLKGIKERCEDKNNCVVAANRETFGKGECPDANDDAMNMWIVYRCEGGCDSSKITGLRCQMTLSTTTTIQTTTQSVCDTIKGQVEEKEVPGCGGRLRMSCTGGCIDISHVQYTCRENERSIPDQLERVQKRCQGKSSCAVAASRRMFGESECPEAAVNQMKMTVKYRCNGGGRDDTKVKQRNDPTCKQTCPADHGEMKTEDIPINGGWINILCSARADRNPPNPCIFIHKVRADFSWGAPIAEHMTLVSLGNLLILGVLKPLIVLNSR